MNNQEIFNRSITHKMSKVSGRDILNPGSQMRQVIESSQVTTRDNWGEGDSVTGQDGVTHHLSF